MNIILLSGGSGKRLWPLSNEIRSKQFLQLFKGRDGKYESMLQRVYRQLNDIGIQTNVTVATSKSQVSAVYGQLGNDVECCVEPCRKDTFPAVALSAAYLVDVKGVKPSEAVVVCPVDPLVTSEYFRSLIALQYPAELEMSNVVLMGIVPTSPVDCYGYIMPESENKLSGVKFFKEKPTREQAEEYIKDGALWNAGVFAFKLQYILSRAKEILGYNKYDEILAHYDSFPEVSFDVAVVEKEKSVQVMRFAGTWGDMGTWNILTEAMSDPVMGNGIIDESSTGVQIINETDTPILAMGLHDVVISASEDGILVSDKDMSSLIKPFVEKFENKNKNKNDASKKKAEEAAGEVVKETVKEETKAAEEEKVIVASEDQNWGSKQVLDSETGSKTIKITIEPGATMEYHSHEKHDEVWIIVSGEGQVILDEKRSNVKQGDIITMKAGCKHAITAGTELKLIEIQLGDDTEADDKKEYDLLVALSAASLSGRPV